jgi:hypothetical protein
VPVGIFDTAVITNSDVNQYVTVQKIPRRIVNTPENPAITAEMLSGIKEGFFNLFPYDNSKVNNNIPPLLGFYVDNSRSLGRAAVEPAVDQFVNFYKSYSFASGVRDFYGNPASGYVYEYVPSPEDKGEEWFKITNNLMDELLDTGRLIQTGNDILITSGVGLEFANENATEFNTVPDSGGRAYVFEKEGDSWTLIQEIKSNQVNEHVLNRFGHSVSISDDSYTIAVGSPFTKDSCNIYTFNDTEKGRLYDNIGPWLEFRNSGQYDSTIEFYETVKALSGIREAGKQAYLSLDHNGRYKSRTDSEYWECPISDLLTLLQAGHLTLDWDIVVPLMKMELSPRLVLQQIVLDYTIMQISTSYKETDSTQTLICPIQFLTMPLLVCGQLIYTPVL